MEVLTLCDIYQVAITITDNYGAVMAKRKRKQRGRPTAIFSCLTRTKSTIESIRGSIASACIYVDFAKRPHSHGLKHTVEKKLHWFERYNKEPVVVSMQRDYRSWWTTFPAVTACFLERVHPDKAREVIQTIWNVTEESDAEKYQYYYEFVELIADVSFRDNLQNFWKYQADDTVKGIDLLQLAMSVHPEPLLEVLLSKSDYEVHWYLVMTDRWYLPDLQLSLRSSDVLQDTWRPHELLQCHYHSGQCFVRIDSKNRAVRYFIHSPYEIPTAISNPTGEVAPDVELIVDFKAVEIQASASVKNLRTEQRRCKYPDEWISDSIRHIASLCVRCTAAVEWRPCSVAADRTST
ncbi:unnamed protein product [Chrysodeixis includens]|uniref:Uncharacterized protein n=1 Tax=Chrysodeixis includens TaxID=689277 RepID=A0A9N8L7Y3_CHRIL|nr:unnamed protein product [Chrysodeixis includens]